MFEELTVLLYLYDWVSLYRRFGFMLVAEVWINHKHFEYETFISIDLLVSCLAYRFPFQRVLGLILTASINVYI
jgi:hypothetical protein